MRLDKVGNIYIYILLVLIFKFFWTILQNNFHVIFSSFFAMGARWSIVVVVVRQGGGGWNYVVEWVYVVLKPVNFWCCIIPF